MSKRIGITDTQMTRISEELNSLPRRRKTYSRKAALENLADLILNLLRRGCNIDSICWKLERRLNTSKKEIEEVLLKALQAEYPDKAPETVLAELIADGRPAVETTATPRAIEHSKPATGALPMPENANLTSSEQEGVLQEQNPSPETVNSELAEGRPQPPDEDAGQNEGATPSLASDRIHIAKRNIYQEDFYE